MDNAKTTKAIYREAEKAKERANPYNLGIRFAQILGVGSYSEEVRISSFPTKAIVPHPFLSISSWIRGMPEIGSTVSAQFTKENNEVIITGYRSLNPKESLKEAASGNSLYQELLPGELDFMSSGLSHEYKASRPIDVREAGLVRSMLDGDTSCLINKSVTFIDILHQNEVATIKDTRRFGVVRRPKNSIETALVRAPDESSATGVSTEKQPFAKENTLILVTKDGKYLLDYREGNVIEDDGTSPVSAWTGKNLRLRKKYFNTNQNATSVEIDCFGNIDVYIPEEAENGFRCVIAKGSAEVNVENSVSVISTKDSLYKADGDSTLTIQAGYFKKEITKDSSISVDGNRTITIKGTHTATADKDVTIQAKGTSTLSVGGFLTNLGQEGKAKHPLLYGDDWIKEFLQFLIKLATHVHPGISVPSPDIAAACAEFAEKCPTFVSTNVQTQ